jgi:hypothetical protein
MNGMSKRQLVMTMKNAMVRILIMFCGWVASACYVVPHSASTRSSHGVLQLSWNFLWA